MRFVLAWGIAMLLALTCQATDVTIYLPFFNANPATNRTITWQAMTPFPGNLNFITSDSTSNAVIQDAPYGLINGVVKAPPGVINFQLWISSTSLGSINASNCLASGSSSTYPAGQVAWAIATSDQRYQLAGTSLSNTFYPLFSNPSNYVQNSTLLTASNAIATNVSLTVVTNIVNGQTNGLATTNYANSVTNPLTATAYKPIAYFQPADSTLTNLSGVPTNKLAFTNSPFFDVNGSANLASVNATNNDMVLSNAVYRAGTNAPSSQSAFNATNGMGQSTGLAAFHGTNEFDLAGRAQAATNPIPALITNIANAQSQIATNGLLPTITNIATSVSGSGNFIVNNNGFGTNTTLNSPILTNTAHWNDTLSAGYNMTIGPTTAVGYQPSWNPKYTWRFLPSTTADAFGLFVTNDAGFHGGATIGILAGQAWIHSLYIDGILITNLNASSTVTNGSGITITTNGNVYTISANSQTNNSVFQNGNASNLIAQTSLSIGGAIAFQINTNTLCITNCGCVLAQGTYAFYASGGVYTNLNDARFTISFSSPTWFLKGTNVSLYQSSTLTGNYSVIGGATAPAPNVVSGATLNYTGINPLSFNRAIAQSFWGSNDPNGVVIAPIGSTYVQFNNGLPKVMLINTNGLSGWY